MSIILLILKIIGIVLLIILGLLLILALAVMLIPVRYRISGEAQDTVSVRFWVSWLRPCISWRAHFKAHQFEQKLKIFGFSLKKREGDRKPKKKRRARKNRDSKIKSEIVVQTPEAVQEPGTKLQVPEAAEEHVSQSVEGPVPEAVEEHVPEFEKEPVSEEIDTISEKKRLLDRIKSFFLKLRKLPGMIKAKLVTIKEKALDLKSILKRIGKEFRDETNQKAVVLLWHELTGILKHFAPRRVRIDGTFSAGEPASTGQVLGLISVFPFVYRYKINLYPDFEDEKLYFKGSFDIKGYIRGIHAMVLLVHLIKDKNIRSLLQRYRNS